MCRGIFDTTNKTLRESPCRRSDRMSHPNSSGLFALVFCHKDHKNKVEYRPGDYSMRLEGREPTVASKHGFVFNDVFFPAIEKRHKELLAGRAKTKLMLPLQAYTFLIEALAPRLPEQAEPPAPPPSVDNPTPPSPVPSPVGSATPATPLHFNLDEIFILRDVAPTYCLGAIPAMAAGYIYTGAGPLDYDALANIKSLMLMHFNDQLMTSIFATWRPLVPKLLPRRTPASGRKRSGFVI